MTVATSNRLATRQHQQGFTLLEVMVVLAILAMVAISASQASRSYVQSVDNMKTRTFGYYVAQNTLAELRLQKLGSLHPILANHLAGSSMASGYLTANHTNQSRLCPTHSYSRRAYCRWQRKKTWWILMRYW